LRNFDIAGFKGYRLEGCGVADLVSMTDFLLMISLFDIF
jgi:hypothetical protein